jgi:predicted SAM-dependent methyltransferase
MASEPLRLNIGGTARRPGWKVLNIVPGPHVDFVGDCADLSQFAAGSIEEVYASPVLEHLGLVELPKALAEVRRVVRAGGRFLISVPDLEVLCRFMLNGELTLQERFEVMRMIYGGQSDPYDFHKIGLTRELLCGLLGQAGFRLFKVVEGFDLFSGHQHDALQGQARQPEHDCSMRRFAFGENLRRSRHNRRSRCQLETAVLLRSNLSSSRPCSKKS